MWFCILQALTYVSFIKFAAISLRQLELRCCRPSQSTKRCSLQANYVKNATRLFPRLPTALSPLRRDWLVAFLAALLIGSVITLNWFCPRQPIRNRYRQFHSASWFVGCQQWEKLEQFYLLEQLVDKDLLLISWKENKVIRRLCRCRI